jgi:hypothetical protein
MGRNKDMPPQDIKAPSTGQGRYEVWHREGDDFMAVASVRVGNLLGALVFTMNRKDAPWSDNEQVTALLQNARSTDLGDVIVDPEGVAYQVQNTQHGLVFRPIDFPQHREQRALLAEWEADYVAARERDIKALFGAAPIRASEPSQAANENAKDRGGRES